MTNNQTWRTNRERRQRQVRFQKKGNLGNRALTLALLLYVNPNLRKSPRPSATVQLRTKFLAKWHRQKTKLTINRVLKDKTLSFTCQAPANNASRRPRTVTLARLSMRQRKPSFRKLLTTFRQIRTVQKFPRLRRQINASYPSRRNQMTCARLAGAWSSETCRRNFVYSQMYKAILFCCRFFVCSPTPKSRQNSHEPINYHL